LVANDHFKSLAITVNGRSISVVLAGIHRSICSLDARGFDSARKNLEILFEAALPRWLSESAQPREGPRKRNDRF
jgi:hypothetical protein